MGLPTRAQVLAALKKIQNLVLDTVGFDDVTFGGNSGIDPTTVTVVFTRVVNTPTLTACFVCNCQRVQIIGLDETTQASLQMPSASRCGQTPCTIVTPISPGAHAVALPANIATQVW